MKSCSVFVYKLYMYLVIVGFHCALGELYIVLYVVAPIVFIVFFGIMLSVSTL